MSNEIGLRPIKPIAIAGVVPAEIGETIPAFEWVDPTTLMVEDSYQRSLAAKSVTLIRKIVSDWDWNRMKPPIVARNASGHLCVVDGQHTAIAAASHPGIEKIPVMIIESGAVSGRAAAFIGHNRDRVAMTPMQMHYAAVAAGDEIAVAVAEACRKTGVTILKVPPPNGFYKLGDTVAVASISSIVERKGVPGGSRVLKVLIDAARSPIRSDEVKAVSALLFEQDYAGQVSEFDLATVIRSKSADDWAAQAETRVRKGRKMPLWRAISIVWFQSLPKRRPGNSP